MYRTCDDEPNRSCSGGDGLVRYAEEVSQRVQLNSSPKLPGTLALANSMLLSGRSGRLMRRQVRQAMHRARQTSERNSRSVYFLGVFFVLVVFMLLAEVVYVDPYSTVTTYGSTQPKDSSWLYNIVPSLGNNFERVEEVHLEMGEINTHKLDKLYSEARTDHWQPIGNVGDKFFVFSAFMDRRRNVIKYVRVIAVARTRFTDRVKCVFWSANRTSVVATVLASNRLIRENWNLRYSAFFLLCPIPLNSGLPRDYVPHALSRFAEFVEMHRLLGYQHFFFYNHTIGPHVGALVNNYVQRGIATVLPWQLDLVSQREIRTEGLFAALNDCLYRSMYRFQYTAMVDFDEVIVPKLKANSTVLELLTVLRRANPMRHGAFSFQNAFFYLQYPDEEVPFPDPAKELLYLRKTRRKGKLHNHRLRSKYIVVPERVQEVGNHFVWEFMPNFHMFNVNPNAGFLHHYRICEFGGDSCTINSSSVVDKTLHAYADRLVDAYARAMSVVHPANYSRYYIDA
ncbi:uncharacterized protein LOC111255297 isoform X2 [Varroa destructor]|uniref:Glycosyltransferase family 92 protein n=1 Tax=Varroa destructor TaxID=109461 RepID=A0A7M7KZC7_VARDE|nr:uncharacterized protein LOC111255297 isoform X2 [Varroa destructor]